MFGHLVESNFILSLIWLNISKYSYSMSCFVKRLSPFDLKQTKKIMCDRKRLSRTVYYIHDPIDLSSNWLISDGFVCLRCGQPFIFRGSLFPERYIFGVLGQLYCIIVEHIKAVVVIVIFIYN